MKKGLLLIVLLAALAGGGGLYYYYAEMGGGGTDYVILARSAPQEIPPIELPDITKYTPETLASMLPPLAAGKVSVVKLAESKLPVMPSNSYLPDYERMQGRPQPVGIEIESGVYDMGMIAAAVADPAMVERAPGGWRVNVPVTVHPGAALVVRGKENTLFMNADSGAYIGAFGKVYMLDTAMTGWSWVANAPALFASEDAFRPFVTVWSGGEGYFAGTAFANLGYAAWKSYGVSYAKSKSYGVPHSMGKKRATGWFVGNTVEDLYYGFYTYEADDIAIVGNTFKNCIIYGIDPHDDSRRLIIAKNDSYGAKKKHGIIVSRYVSDSFIFDNHSHDNYGSGIMIDRNSMRNVIANNKVENNKAEGIVFFESSDNRTYKNTVTGNGRNGVVIRNARNIVLDGDIIRDNKQYGITAYTTSLAGQEKRNTNLDPYVQETGYAARDLTMEGNKEGHIKSLNVSVLDISGSDLYGVKGFFAGDMEKHSRELFGLVSTPQGVEVRKEGFTAFTPIPPSSVYGHGGKDDKPQHAAPQGAAGAETSGETGSEGEDESGGGEE